MIRSMGIAWWSWKGVRTTAVDLRTWTPLVLLGVARFAALLFLVFFHEAFWVRAALPVVEFFGGAAASHYPDHLFLLPQTFAGLDRWVLLLAGTPVVVAATRSIASSLVGAPRSRIPGGVAILWRVGGVALLLVGLEAAVASIFGFLPQTLRESGGKIELALMLLQAGTLILVASPFAGAIASIVVRDESTWKALQRSVRIASVNPVTVLLVTALPVLASFPFLVLSGSLGRSRLADTPEAMVLVVAARILVELVALHVTLTAMTRVALWNASEE